ncbi:MAG: sigma factor-like helix-turn-helix DNA-binding protein [Desulfobacterales bacterium]|jgi:DNA-directed RNA polymerase specialized sigma24 family protein
MNAFYQCLSQMPQRLADAFVYREVDGLNTEEICKVLEITATTGST